jgi:alpha-D-ribose 1-methylphosphonate 5-triphosphate synthase subunit PhnG
MDPAALVRERQRVMGLLARASGADVEALLADIGPLPPAEDIRSPETGLVMVQGRAGGDGAPFNLGEATVSRAAVRLPDGTTGFSYLLGRDRRKARTAALVDALVQVDGLRSRVEPALSALAARIEEAERRHARRVAATRVDFFTLARGQD